MKLTKRQRHILELLTTEECEEDLVQEGLEVWCGHVRTSWRTLKFLLQNMLVSEADFSGKIYRYGINEWGRLALTDPNFEPQLELAKAAAEARQNAAKARPLKTGRRKNRLSASRDGL